MPYSTINDLYLHIVDYKENDKANKIILSVLSNFDLNDEDMGYNRGYVYSGSKTYNYLET